LALISKTPAYTFDDLMLAPRLSTIDSRFNGEIDLSTQILPNVTLKYPIISANMDTVTGVDMLLAMERLGGLGIHHRFCDVEVQLEALRWLSDTAPKIACIGVGNGQFERLTHLVRRSKALAGVLIDIAHGHHEAMGDQIRRIKQEFPDLSIIAGNVATQAGVRYLAEAGADCVKVGVGCGSLCTTRLQTGNGIPQMTAIMEADQGRHSLFSGRQVTIIADGGIRYAGDAVKALAAGADAVMVGSMLAGTDETPGDIIQREEKGLVSEMKSYRGMASFSAQKAWKKAVRGIEGEETIVPAIGPVEEVFGKITEGILSGMSYQGAKNLEELRSHAVFRVQTYAGVLEAMPFRKTNH
jgi:IMP dehydrogenase